MVCFKYAFVNTLHKGGGGGGGDDDDDNNNNNIWKPYQENIR